MDVNKIYSNKSEFIEKELENVKNKLDKNLDKLPNEELPFMENHLRSLYFQTYFLLAYSFYNASIIVGSILLESLVKEKLFMEGLSYKEIEKMTLGDVINKCKKMKVLNEEEIVFLEIKKKLIRNPYAHYNLMELTEGIKFKGWKVSDPVEKLKELNDQVMKGKLTELEARQKFIEGAESAWISPKEMRPLAQIAKSGIEETGAFNIFSDIDKFIREFAEKYFKPK